MRPCRYCGSIKIRPSRVKKCDWICNTCSYRSDSDRGKPIFGVSPQKTIASKEDIAWLHMLYKTGKTAAQIAKHFGVSVVTVRKRLIEYGAYKKRGGRGNPIHERGCTDKGGYKLIRIYPEDELYSKLSKGGRKSVKIRMHRYVMAVHMGRALHPWEVVHHINHKKDDNRLENLQLFSGAIEHVAETLAHTHFVKMTKEIANLKDQLSKYE